MNFFYITTQVIFIYIEINLNVLSNNTYNTFVKKIISSQIEHGKKKLIKVKFDYFQAKSTENFYKKNLNILKI